DDAEPGLVRCGERGGERGLEAVEGRLHDVEDGLAGGACRPGQREGARRGGTGEREPDGAVGAGTPALHQGAQQGRVFEASRLRRRAVDLVEVEMRAEERARLRELLREAREREFLL